MIYCLIVSKCDKLDIDHLILKTKYLTASVIQTFNCLIGNNGPKIDQVIFVNGNHERIDTHLRNDDIMLSSDVIKLSIEKSCNVIKEIKQLLGNEVRIREVEGGLDE